MYVLTQDEIAILRLAVRHGKYEVNKFNEAGKLAAALTQRRYLNYGGSHYFGSKLIEVCAPTETAILVDEFMTQIEVLQTRIQELEKGQVPS